LPIGNPWLLWYTVGMSDAPRKWTVLALIGWTKAYLARAGVDEPRLAAEVLLAHVLACDRMHLYARHDRPVGPDRLAAYRALIRRAAAGEPVAYLVGRKEFYSLSLKVTPGVLIPRPETELLVDAALEFVRAGGGVGRLWDVGTGSGCVAVAVATYAPDLEVLATDVSESALAVAAENVARHGLAGRVRLARADLLDLPDAGGPFDAIAANLPYIRDDQMSELPGVVQAEPDVALRAGPTGLEFIARLVADAPERLRPGGLLAMEIGLGQAEEVHDLLDRAGPYELVHFRKDAAGIERTVTARRK
jgi:release factor glutamine methyltransferase